MIDAIIQGRLRGVATAKTGKPFAVAKVRITTGDGESLFVSAIAFDAAPCAALLALGEGDAVSMAGTLTPKIWTDKSGVAHPALDIVAQQVLTTYHVTRKRKAVAPPGQQQQGYDFDDQP